MASETAREYDRLDQREPETTAYRSEYDGCLFTYWLASVPQWDAAFDPDDPRWCIRQFNDKVKCFDKYQYGVQEALGRMLNETPAYVDFNSRLMASTVRAIRFGACVTETFPQDVGAPQGNVTGCETVNKDSNTTTIVIRKAISNQVAYRYRVLVFRKSTATMPAALLRA